jgi:indolepyruvate ferredoxin oxidoreductase
MNAPISLNDKYTATEGRVFLNGTQALVRLPMTQMRRDRAAGLNTGTFISGYRGSPLGAYDQQILNASKFLSPHNIKFTPGVNEELAATAVWGSQQTDLFDGAKTDGVVGIWYGKGPGVDRTGDVFKHANAAGTSRHGGVLALAGDDHTCKSSTIPHQSDHAFMAASMPLLYPSSVHEILEYGLFGIAMSRFSGLWTGLKVIADTIETTSVVELAQEQRSFVIPTDFEIPDGGLNIRWPDVPLVQDARLHEVKSFAALAFARANRIDTITHNTPKARFGIISAGKAYEDTISALRYLDLGPEEQEKIGLRVYKVRMPWPLEPEGAKEFAHGLDEIFVVEERREMIENQLKNHLYHLPNDQRPRVYGKTGDKGERLLPISEGLRVETVARALALRLLELKLPAPLKSHLRSKIEHIDLEAIQAAAAPSPLARTPYFCAGCPHNTSTRVPEGSKAIAGIGCHYMTVWMDRDTETFSQMGGEGTTWVGLSEFTDDEHRFVNIGDGTFIHSGSLALRQSVVAGVNVTYKVLYNDAVAMTGGQSLEGMPSPARITRQLASEGVHPIYLLSDEPELYKDVDLAKGTIVHHRDHLDPVMLELRETKGCSAIVYVQTCAAEKRRRRKRGTLVDPDKRVFINPDVCEGCGDCSVQSNCVAVEPLDTAFGRKRQINQSSCNKDFSCVNGFCPAFVTVTGAAVRRPEAATLPDMASLPLPKIPVIDKPYNIAVAGIGGTGVLTIGAVLGMASHIDRVNPIILDQAGLAQKNGAVFSHIRIAPADHPVTAPRIPVAAADVILAADSVVAASYEGISLCTDERTTGIVNAKVTPISDFIRNRDFDFQEANVEKALRNAVISDDHFHNFSSIALAVTGDEISANTMMMGYAWQMGLIPLTHRALTEAISLNGVAVKANLAAFDWGRLLAADPEKIREFVTNTVPKPMQDLSLEAMIEHRVAHLTDYQNADLAKKYKDALEMTSAKAANLSDDDKTDLLKVVAISYSKLLSFKDEYEVARLHTNGKFEDALAQKFTGDFKISYHMSPPVIAGRAPNGRPNKRQFGPWMTPVLNILAKGKVLRGTWADPFSYMQERKAEKELITQFETDLDFCLSILSPKTVTKITSVLALANDIRGYGPVKNVAIERATAERKKLLGALKTAPPTKTKHAAE